MTHWMVNNNLLNISTCLKMKDRKANSYVTTMLWDYITLMTPKSRMETAFVASFFVPQMSPPSGLGHVPTLLRKPKTLLLEDQGSVKSSRPAEQGRIFWTPERKALPTALPRSKTVLRTPVKLYWPLLLRLHRTLRLLRRMGPLLMVLPLFQQKRYRL